MQAIQLNPRITVLLFAALLCKSILRAQVGIGTSKPDTSTILEIRSSTKGVLIPRLTEFQRSRITETADGLLVQDLHTGKTVTNRDNYGQWGVVDPVINTNVNFTAFLQPRPCMFLIILLDQRTNGPLFLSLAHYRVSVVLIKSLFLLHRQMYMPSMKTTVGLFKSAPRHLQVVR